MCLTKPFQKPDNEKYDPLQMTNNYPAVDRYDAIWSSFFRGEKQKQFTQNSKGFIISSPSKNSLNCTPAFQRVWDIKAAAHDRPAAIF